MRWCARTTRGTDRKYPMAINSKTLSEYTPYKSLHNLSGMQFGYWRVVRYSHNRPKRSGFSHYWWCRCQCGIERSVGGNALRYGKSRSCGCKRPMLISQKMRTHGDTKSAEFAAWKSMLDRCEKPSTMGYHLYGGRGIRVCRRWKVYQAFLSDMGRRPTTSHSLDRIDNAKGYSLGNCRWADDKTQARNRRNNHRIQFAGKTLCIAEWAEITGIPSNAISLRIKAGWPIKKALSKPARKSRRVGV